MLLAVLAVVLVFGAGCDSKKPATEPAGDPPAGKGVPRKGEPARKPDLAPDTLLQAEAVAKEASFATASA